MSEWRGWVISDVALYLDRPATSRWVEIYLQYGDGKARSIGRFVDQNAAREFQTWMHAAITVVGRANTALAAELEI